MTSFHSPNVMSKSLLDAIAGFKCPFDDQRRNLHNRATRMAELLEMRGVSKVFPGVRALDGVDFTVRRGEIHALMGENGAGK